MLTESYSGGQKPAAQAFEHKVAYVPSAIPLIHMGTGGATGNKTLQTVFSGTIWHTASSFG